MKISIIIPAYNAEKYIERCLKSVLAAFEGASGASGEILVVDNGSRDKTLVVARKCLSRRVSGVETHMLRCDVPGAAAARNFGFSHARGEFVWFIDADDYISPEAISKLLGRSSGIDLVMMGAERIARDGSTSYLSAVDPLRPDWKSRFVRYGMGPWQVIIRRQWWLEQGLSFREGMIHEDMELMSSLVLHTDNLASVDEALYFYCDNPESVLHKSKFDPHIFDIFPALEGLQERFVKAGADKKYHDELEWFFIWNLLIDSAKDFGAFPEGRVGFSRARKMLRDYYPNWRKNRFLREKSVKLRVKVRLNYARNR